VRPLRLALPGVMIALATVVGGPAIARDHDDARHAVERGDIRPLAEILATVRDKLPGEIVRVEIEQRGGHWRYEFRTVDAQGRLFDVFVDARTGDVVRIREK
jgi:uncharacterized membrane protein YkoI